MKRIALFGSYSRDDQRDSSDIDLLVEFDEKAMTFDNYMDLKFNLEGFFQKSVVYWSFWMILSLHLNQVFL